jgi:cytochrome c oxidase cbb3-type subunit 2
MAALLVAQGCAKKESAETSPAASAPQAAAPAAPPVSEPAAAPAAADAATAPAAEAPATAAAGDTAAGEKVYKAFCVTCHGVTGKGDGLAAAGLNPKPLDFSVGAFKYDANGNGTKGDIEDIMAIVHDGAAKHGGSPLMTPWPMIKPDQLQAVAEYVKSLHGA